MIKQIRYILGTLILLLMVVLNVTFTSNAYTEEEKQQAKAWLSTHGYSPDMGGANQAYQDYLNGKFDEELGYDTNGDGIPAATTEETSSNLEGTTAETKDGTKAGDEKQKQEASTQNVPAEKGVTEDAKQKDTDTEESEGQQSKEQPKTKEAEKDIKQTSAEMGEIENAAANNPQKKEIYRNVIIVIGTAILVMLLSAFLYIKYIQKKQSGR